MAKKRKPQTLSDAKKYYKQLLYEASGGNLGSRPEAEIKNTSMTFAEKRGLLDSIIKIAQMEAKSAGDEEEPSGLELIKRNLDADRTDRGSRDHGRAESGADESSGSSEDDTEDA